MTCTLQQAFTVNILTALSAHFWFKTHEPQNYWLLIAIIFALPVPSLALLVPHVPSFLLTAGLAYFTFLTTLFSSIVLYRISPLHPLASYPGPLLWRITKLAPAWYGAGGKYHLHLKRLHEQYGPIVRIGPNEVSIVDKDLIPFILGPLGMPKGPLWEGRRVLPAKNFNINNSLVAVRDLDRHAQLRKPWNKSFGTTPLKDYGEMLVLRANFLSERLEHISKSAEDNIGRIDLAKWMSFFSFDFMGDIAFASDFSLLRDGDVNNFIKNMEDAHYLPTIVQHIPWFAKVARVTPFIGSKLRRFGGFALTQARKRGSQSVLRKDLFHHLFQATDPDLATSPLPLIMANTVLTIIAGSDTAASALSNTFYFLLSNPEHYKRLKKEIDDTAADIGGSLPSLEKLSSLPFLNAVINESLRVQPPVPTALQRAPKIGSGGKMVGSIFLPEGTAVQVPPYVLHRDPRYFHPSPDTFWPDRWLLENDVNGIHERNAFIPFSTGPANCAGKPLAMHELRYVTALLIRTFDIEFDDGFDSTVWEDNLTDRLVLCKGELRVKLSPRSL